MLGIPARGVRSAGVRRGAPVPNCARRLAGGEFVFRTLPTPPRSHPLAVAVTISGEVHVAAAAATTAAAGVVVVVVVVREHFF